MSDKENSISELKENLVSTPDKIAGENDAPTPSKDENPEKKLSEDPSTSTEEENPTPRPKQEKGEAAIVPQPEKKEQAGENPSERLAGKSKKTENEAGHSKVDQNTGQESDPGEKDNGETSKAVENDAEQNAESHDDKSHEIEMKDYHAMGMPELLKELSRLMRTEKIQDIKKHVEEIKNEFNAKFEEEIEQKREDFLQEGGNLIDFYYSSPLKKEFNSVYFDYKEKRNAHYQEVKKNLNQNLASRLAIIEELKGMIGLGESMNSNFHQFKELQERWKKAGPIPRDKYNMVFNTYHHHVEHFYDFLHLDREFRDMDFKHNLEQKLKIIARAEELSEETNINRAFRELQMLHKMWKEDLGPVAKQYRDEVWEKFSEATKKIHENRQSHFAEQDKKMEEHLKVKQELIEKIKTLTDEGFDSHNKIQQKIKEIEHLRQEFFNAGKVQSKHNRKIWTAFKEAGRAFNHKKNSFYKDLKKEQYENLEKKRELIKIAEENKDNEDFENVTPIMKKIQDDWKKIGHVPRRDSDKVWKKFKSACNHYFDKLHTARDEENKEENEAFEQKKAVLENLKKLEPQGDREKDLANIKSKIEDWKKIGRVPTHKNYIEKKFNHYLDGYFDKLGLEKSEAEMLKYENRIQALDDSNDLQKIEREQSFLRKKIDDVKSEIRQLENNLQFFAHADQENPLVKEAHENLSRHKEKLDTWKAKLKKVKAL